MPLGGLKRCQLNIEYHDNIWLAVWRIAAGG
jgi:hypothetical protein